MARKILAVICVFLTVGLTKSVSPSFETTQEQQRFVYAQLHMGVRVDITLYAPDQNTADNAAQSAYSRYAELEQIMSDYRPSSELMQLCERSGEGPIKVSDDLFTVLSQAQEMSKLTRGAFDISASPIIRAWRESRRQNQIPDAGLINDLLHRVNWGMILLDDDRKTATLLLKGMQLDLGGIAKGFANDEAIKAMKQHGVSRSMIQAGGDITVSDAPPNKLGWAIQVRGLPDTIYLKHAAVGTSGDTEQFVEIDGVRYSHIVDPRTGYGATSRILATVISPTGSLSDSFGTAATIMPPSESKRIARSLGVTLIMTVVTD